MSDKIDWKFIGAREGAEVLVGYVPMKNGKVIGASGVTIATGFDLGQRNESDLKRLKLSDELFKKLKPYLLKKKDDAVKFLKDNPLTITKEQAKEIDVAVKKLEVPTLRTRYDTSPYNKGKVGADKKIIKVMFDDLPSQAQTVIASMAFQWGNLARTETLEFWKLVCVQDWAEAVKWLNKQTQYKPRRQIEAKLLAQLVKLDKERASLMPSLSIWECVFLFAVLFVGSGIAFAQTAPLIFDAETLSAYKNYNESLEKKLSPLNFESGKTVTNCREYLEEKKTSAVGETVADTMFHSEYLDCDIVPLLKQSKEANSLVLKKSSKFNYGMELYNRLDLRSFPTSFNDSADDKKTKLPKNLKQNGYWKPKITNLGIESDAKMWSFEIRVIADIDANNDGKKDLILVLAEQAIKEGNYRSYQSLLISDYKKKGYLKARQL